MDKIDVAKRRKVINALIGCSNVQSQFTDAVYVCPTCMYGREDGWPCESLAPLLDDVLELLKAQGTTGDCISRSELLAAYDAVHEGPPGRARKLIEEAPSIAREAREPRVLRVEEVVLLKQNDVVWLEDYDKKDVIPAIVSRMGAMVICIEFALSDRFISVGYDDYGSRWRCWTSRSTNEQREAIPWISCNSSTQAT